MCRGADGRQCYSALHAVTEEVSDLGSITSVLAPTSGGTQATTFLQAQLNLTLGEMWPFLDHPQPDPVLVGDSQGISHTISRKGRGFGQWHQKKKGNEPRACSCSLSLSGSSIRAALSTGERTHPKWLLSAWNVASLNWDTLDTEALIWKKVCQLSH